MDCAEHRNLINCEAGEEGLGQFRVRNNGLSGLRGLGYREHRTSRAQVKECERKRKLRYGSYLLGRWPSIIKPY